MEQHNGDRFRNTQALLYTEHRPSLMTVDEYLAFEECDKMQHKDVDGESLGHSRGWHSAQSRNFQVIRLPRA